MFTKHFKTRIVPALLIAAALIIWILDASREAQSNQVDEPSRVEATHSAERAPEAPKGSKESGRRYETYEGCKLVDDRGNDGDSFLVQLPNGQKELFRLYFVDAPESRFRTYGGGQTNHRRIQQQADALGGITAQQAVEVGSQTKLFVLGLLEGLPFTLHTEWDSPFNDRRYHAFVEVIYQGETRLLHEILVERGLARIHTKPADLPDGTPATQQLKHLRSLEREAKSKQVGAWKY